MTEAGFNAVPPGTTVSLFNTGIATAVIGGVDALSLSAVT